MGLLKIQHVLYKFECDFITMSRKLPPHQPIFQFLKHFIYKLCYIPQLCIHILCPARVIEKLYL